MTSKYSLTIYVGGEHYAFFTFLNENKAITHRAQIQTAMKRYESNQVAERFYQLSSDLRPDKELSIDIRHLVESRNVMFILKKEA